MAKKVKKRKRTPEQKQEQLDWELMNQTNSISFSEDIIETQSPEYIEALIEGL